MTKDILLPDLLTMPIERAIITPARVTEKENTPAWQAFFIGNESYQTLPEGSLFAVVNSPITDTVVEIQKHWRVCQFKVVIATFGGDKKPSRGYRDVAQRVLNEAEADRFKGMIE